MDCSTISTYCATAIGASTKTLGTFGSSPSCNNNLSNAFFDTAHHQKGINEIIVVD